MTTSDRSAFTTHRALASQSREQLLHLLNESDEVLTISELADRTGLHPNTVREHLNILIAAELVNSESQTSGGRGRPKRAYRATATSSVPNPRSSQETDSLELLCRVLAAQAAQDNFGSSTWEHAENSARQWVHDHADEVPTHEVNTAEQAIEVITELLDQRGFAPVAEPNEQRVVLHACPYGELAAEQQQVICGAHLGLVLGALERAGSPVKARFADIDPFTPRCVIQLVDPPAIREDQL